MDNLASVIVSDHMIRKSKKQKQEFRELVKNTLENEGHTVSIDENKKFPYSKNIIIGDLENADFIFTAHYDTPARLPFPNICMPLNKFWFVIYQILMNLVIFIIPLILFVIIKKENPMLAMNFLFLSAFGISLLMLAGPSNKNNYNDNTSGVITVIQTLLKAKNKDLNVCAVLFDHEELGLLGSSYFFRKNKELLTKKIVVNFDCVGDGDNLLFITKNVDKEILDLITLEDEKKNLMIKGYKNCIYPSDQKWFLKSIGVCSLNKYKNVYYFDKIHTNKDIVLDLKNIEILSDISISLLVGSLDNNVCNDIIK